jgi:hypothetical protein
MDRRSLFFAGAALVSALLIPVTESAQRWVPIVLAIVYVLLGAASWADHRTRRAGRRVAPADATPRRTAG